MRRLVTIAVAAAMLATPALAADEAVVLRVKISDLDLQTRAGAEQALDRINHAARDVCTVPETRSRIRHVDERCFTNMTSRAVASLKAPMVLALYRAQNPEQEG